MFYYKLHFIIMLKMTFFLFIFLQSSVQFSGVSLAPPSGPRCEKHCLKLLISLSQNHSTQRRWWRGSNRFKRSVGGKDKPRCRNRCTKSITRSFQLARLSFHLIWMLSRAVSNSCPLAANMDDIRSPIKAPG